MREIVRGGWTFVLGSALWATSCNASSGSSCTQGDEGCNCYPNKTCNGDLQCASELCVDTRSELGSEASSGGGDMSSGSSGDTSSGGDGNGGGDADGSSVGGSGSGGGSASGSGGSPNTSSGALSTTGSQTSTTGGGSGDGGGGKGGNGGSGGGNGGSGGGNGGSGGSGSGCTPPTVMVLVDASSSMWDNQFWEPLQAVVLDVIAQYQDGVRFGLATFTGRISTTCPLDLQSPNIISLGNSETISEFYTSIPTPMAASETPTPMAIKAVTELLLADGADDMAILLVTDGNPDFCDNGQTECRADALVRALQDAYDEGITTLVVGLPDPSIDASWLTAYANAGRGQGVTAPVDSTYCLAPPDETAVSFPYDYPMGTYEGGGSAEPVLLDPAEDSASATLASLLDELGACP